MTLNKFIENSGLDAPMVRSIVSRLGGWREAQGDLESIAEHGADAGWSGFTYYNETLSFFKAHKKAILAIVAEMADQCGQGMLETVQSFWRLTHTVDNGCAGYVHHMQAPDYSVEEIADAIYTGRGDGADIIKNALVWFTLEEVANRYENMKE